MNAILEKVFKIRQWLQKKRFGQWALAGVCLVVLVVLFAVFSLGGSGKPAGAQEAGDPGASREALSPEDIEARLEELLSAIEGAGRVRVMITYATGAEIVPAMSTQVQSSTSEQSDEKGSWQKSLTRNEQSSPVTGRNDTQPVVLVEKMPEILGVVVVAEGAHDLKVRMALQQAVETVLQLSSKKVDVFPMEKE